jgi:hypothetical protein
VVGTEADLRIRCQKWIYDVQRMYVMKLKFVYNHDMTEYSVTVWLIDVFLFDIAAT